MKKINSIFYRKFPSQTLIALAGPLEGKDWNLLYCADRISNRLIQKMISIKIFMKNKKIIALQNLYCYPV